MQSLHGNCTEPLCLQYGGLTEMVSFWKCILQKCIQLNIVMKTAIISVFEILKKH